MWNLSDRFNHSINEPVTKNIFAYVFFYSYIIVYFFSQETNKSGV
jgi:hypothetical protein